MVKKSLHSFLQSIVLCFFIYMPAIANEEGKVEALHKTIDVSKLSGINLFFANLYNDNLWLYAVVSILSMALLGIVLASVADFFFSKLGLSVGKMDHKE